MIRCPYCNELLGDKAERCPICRNDFTADDRSKIEEQLSEHRRAIEKEDVRIRQQFRKKIVIIRRITLGLLGLPLIAGLLFAVTKNMMFAWMMGASVILLILIPVISGIIAKTIFCPYCDRYLWYNSGDYCERCGKRIY